MQENQCLGIPIRLDTNQPVQPKTRPRSLKFQIYEEEELFIRVGDSWAKVWVITFCVSPQCRGNDRF